MVLGLVTAGFLLASWVLEAQKPEPVPPPVLTASGTARLVSGSESFELPYAATSVGPLFGLESVARALGGQITEVASGRGFELSLASTKFLLAIETSQVVSGQKILSLSQRPVWVEGRLLAPLDLLELSFGVLGGYEFRFDEAARTLFAERLNVDEVAAALDLVHLQGTSTLVVRFPEGAPRYVVEQVGGGTELRLVGGVFARNTELPRVTDPLVADLKLGLDRLLIELAPGVSGEHYELRQQPFRLVFDFHQTGLAAPFSTGRSSFVPPSTHRGFTVVLDPGHGGVETGAIGKKGSVEKELNLLLSQEIQRQLEAATSVRVLLTRQTDEQIGLMERTAIANENKADLFISVHLNSSLSGRAFGAETYFLSLNASDRQAAASAEIENRSYAGDGESDDLDLILWDLAQTRHLARSQQLANLIQSELNSMLGLKDRGVKQAPFKVLIGAQMPAVLVELGFLSNPEEEAQLKDSAHRSKLAAALVKAVLTYHQPGGEPPPTVDGASGTSDADVSEELPPPGSDP